METKNKLLEAMEHYFGSDKKRINHARRVTGWAEQIMKEESCAEVNELVVILAAVLHDIGIKACEKKYGSAAGHLQEKEGPPIAQGIMKQLGIAEEIIREVCDIIANHHSPGKVNTLNFKIVSDADWLVNLKDEIGFKDKTKLANVIHKVFLTNTGRRLIRRRY